MTALHWAAQNGDAELAQMLLYAGANVARDDAHRRLHAAAPRGQSGSAAVIDGAARRPAPTSNAATAHRRDAADARRRVRQRRRGQGAARRTAPTSTRRNGARPDAADVRRGRRTAPTVVRAARWRTAPISKATSKVVDLAALAREDPARCARSATATAQPPASRRPAAAAAPAPRPARRGARPRPRTQIAGVDRDYQLQRAGRRQGGLTPLLLAARAGLRRHGRRRCSTPAPTSTRSSAGDTTSPLLIATINGHFDLAKLLLERGADPNARGRQRRDAALRRAQRAVGAEGALSAAARATCSRRPTYLELMKALLDKGADPNARLDKQGLVLGLQLRSARASTRSARRRSGAPPTPATSRR